MAGIIGYGAYIPRNRIRVEEIAKVWGADAPSFKKGLMLEEKSVPSPDQDTITMAVEAAKRALKRAGIDPREIGAVYVGSESHPYAVKPSGTVLAEALGATPDVHTADLEFACKAGTEGDVHRPEPGPGGRGQVRPGRRRRHLAGRARRRAGVLGRGRRRGVHHRQGHSRGRGPRDVTRSRPTRRISGAASTSTIRSTAAGSPASPPTSSTSRARPEGIMAKAGMKPADFRYVVFHQPNGKFPLRVGEMLGFTKKQIEPGWLVPKLGNTYSGASPLGLTAILDVAKPGDKILIVSYGSGAGSDAFIFQRDRADRRGAGTWRPGPGRCSTTNKVYLDYGVYAKYRRKIRKAE